MKISMTALQTTAVMAQRVWMASTHIVAVVPLEEKESTAVQVSRDSKVSDVTRCIWINIVLQSRELNFPDRSTLVWLQQWNAAESGFSRCFLALNGTNLDFFLPFTHRDEILTSWNIIHVANLCFYVYLQFYFITNVYLFNTYRINRLFMVWIPTDLLERRELWRQGKQFLVQLYQRVWRQKMWEWYLSKLLLSKLLIFERASHSRFPVGPYGYASSG